MGEIRDRVKELRRVRAGDLVPNARNWRTHDDRQRQALRDVLGAVGYADALLARELPGGRLGLIDGHLRAEETPDALVPVLVVDLTDEEANYLLLTLDPLAGMAGADPARLADLMAEIDLESEALTEELRAMLPAGAVEPGGGGDEFDATPEETGPTRTSAGDLWLIGGVHRLLVGDCTDPAGVARLFGGVEKAVLCNTDPPYGVAYSDAARVAAERTHVRPRRERRWGDHDIDNDELDGPKLQSFLEAYIRAAVPHLTDNAAHYVWHPMLTQGTFFAAAAAADILIHRQIIWVKPGMLFGFGDYHWRHELCFYGWRRGHRPEFYGERNQTTVWEVGHDGATARREHPTQKPTELFARPIANHTRAGQVVYDPFLGSGTQIVAAHRLGRACYGCEIEPRYADVVLRRAEAEGLTCERAG